MPSSGPVAGSRLPRPTFGRVTTRDVAVLAASLAVIAVIALALRELRGVGPTTAALTLLLVVVGAATIARPRIATIVSIVAMLTLNFFFLPPLHTFAIADPQNWVALIVFLVVALVASHLSAAAQDRAREAIARRNEVTRLLDLTRDVLLTTDTGTAVDALARHVARRFGWPRVAICLPADRGWRVHEGGSGTLSLGDAVLDAALLGSPPAAGPDGAAEGPSRRDREGATVSIVPLRHGTRTVGLLAAASPALDVGTLDAVAGVVAIAIERVQFLMDRDAAELVRRKADLAATLLASLSHDLRTPLTAITVAVENLSGELAPADRREQADAAVAELGRLTRVVQDILEMARIDAAAVQIERQWVTAADVIEAARAHVRPALAGHRLRVDADEHLEVEIDPRLTSVALAHLLENAAQYSAAGREILVQARVLPDGLRLSVTDQGPGLDPDELRHVFDRFYRGRAARRASSGTGMGLSITRGLIAAAGGDVRAANTPGAGATFSMIVPGAVRPVSVVS